jgi:SAM-dependent methyltransferase
VTPVDWDTYLDEFHARNPGITEEVLARCTAGQATPYGWLLDGVDPSARIVDLGCGSGPARPTGAHRWVGLDRSVGELRRARETGRSAVVLGDATRLPIADGTVDVVTCSLALMLVRPLDEALAEIHRSLRDGGQLRLLLPTPGPLTAADRVRYLQLFWAARSTTKFPPTSLRKRAGATLERANLRVESDESRRFDHPITGPSDADRFVDSWYLPGTTTARRDAARSRARAMVPVTMGIPLRRVIARRDQ